jgi:histidine triad (HIT) family protein
LDNPLTDDQIEELNEIISLSREEQSKRLPEFLKKLTPEQIEFLKKSQGQQCIFCSIVFGNIPSYKIYEDNDFIAVLDINPANLGHVLVIPKPHLKNIYDVNTRIFEIANLISKKMKEKLNFDFNMIVNNGEYAGQKIEHISVNVIPRNKDDNLNFEWERKKTDENRLKEISSILKVEQEKKEVKKEKIIIKDIKKKERLP